LINGSATTAGSTWTRDDQLTSPGVYEVEALVDLGQTRKIQTIQLLQRGDGCCQDRLQDFTVTLENPAGTVLASQYFGGTAPFTTTMTLGTGQTIEPGGTGAIGTDNVGRTGRYVMVQNNGSGSRRLHSSEIEAFVPGVTPNNNSAPSTNDITGTSYETHIGPWQHGSSASLVDGNLETGGATPSINPGPGNAFVVDLGSTAEVETVRLWQRADGCCQDRLSNFTVSILTDDGSGGFGVAMASQSFPGQVATNSFGAVTFPNAFTISASDILNIEIDPAAGLADLLSVGALGLGALTIDPGATLNVGLLSAPEDGIFNILDFGTLTGTFTNVNLAPLSGGYNWDASNLHVDGTLRLFVPEPSTLAIWTLGLLGLIGWRRRRK
jgi:hypothetical protein